MAVIDPTSLIGQCRLITGDYLDIQRLPDSVYQTSLTKYSYNVNRAARECASFILASLTFSTHEKLGIIETYGEKVFQNYLQYLRLIVSDPAFSSVCPIPYSGSTSSVHPLIKFTKDFNGNFVDLTDSETQELTADPNRTGGW